MGSAKIWIRYAAAYSPSCDGWSVEEVGAALSVGHGVEGDPSVILDDRRSRLDVDGIVIP